MMMIAVGRIKKYLLFIEKTSLQVFEIVGQSHCTIKWVFGLLIQGDFKKMIFFYCHHNPSPCIT